MTTSREMSVERLTQILAAYGAAPGRCPAHERAAAQALMTRIMSAGAPAERAKIEAALNEARLLDGALDDFAAPVPDAAMARLTAAVAFPPRQAAPRAGFRLFDLMRVVFKPAAAVGATMAALGLFVGFSVDPAYSNGDGSDYTVSQAADGGFGAYEGDIAP